MKILEKILGFGIIAFMLVFEYSYNRKSSSEKTITKESSNACGGSYVAAI